MNQTPRTARILALPIALTLAGASITASVTAAHAGPGIIAAAWDGTSVTAGTVDGTWDADMQGADFTDHEADMPTATSLEVRRGCYIYPDDPSGDYRTVATVKVNTSLTDPAFTGVDPRQGGTFILTSDGDELASVPLPTSTVTARSGLAAWADGLGFAPASRFVDPTTPFSWDDGDPQAYGSPSLFAPTSVAGWASETRQQMTDGDFVDVTVTPGHAVAWLNQETGDPHKSVDPGSELLDASLRFAVEVPQDRDRDLVWSFVDADGDTHTVYAVTIPAATAADEDAAGCITDGVPVTPPTVQDIRLTMHPGDEMLVALQDHTNPGSGTIAGFDVGSIDAPGLISETVQLDGQWMVRLTAVEPGEYETTYRAFAFTEGAGEGPDGTPSESAVLGVTVLAPSEEVVEVSDPPVVPEPKPEEPEEPVAPPMVVIHTDPGASASATAVPLAAIAAGSVLLLGAAAYRRRLS